MRHINDLRNWTLKSNKWSPLLNSRTLSTLICKNNTKFQSKKFFSILIRFSTKDLQRKVGLLEKMSLFMGHNPVNICNYQTSAE